MYGGGEYGSITQVAMGLALNINIVQILVMFLLCENLCNVALLRNVKNLVISEAHEDTIYINFIKKNFPLFWLFTELTLLIHEKCM